MDEPDLESRRQRLLAASGRPAWIDACLAVCFGLTLGVASAQVAWSWAVGAVLLVFSIGLGVVLTRSFATRRDVPGEGLADRRSVAAFLVMYLGIVLLSVPEGPAGWRPGWMLGHAGLVTVISYGFLRLTEHFTLGRLARSRPAVWADVAQEAGEGPVRRVLYASLYQVAALDRETVVAGLEVSGAELDEQICVMERAGHLRVERRGGARRSRTWLSLTVPGRQAVAAAAGRASGR